MNPLEFLGNANPLWVSSYAGYDLQVMIVAIFAALVVSYVIDFAMDYGGRYLGLVFYPLQILAIGMLFGEIAGLAGLQAAGGVAFLQQAGMEIFGLLVPLVLFTVGWTVFEFLFFRLLTLFQPVHLIFDAHLDAWLIGPVIEEVVFRLVLLSVLLNAGVPVAAAVFMQALFFSLSHIKDGLLSKDSEWIGLSGINHSLLIGVFLGAIALEWGLVTSIAVHAVFNVLFDVKLILTGGAKA